MIIRKYIYDGGEQTFKRIYVKPIIIRKLKIDFVHLDDRPRTIDYDQPMSEHVPSNNRWKQQLGDDAEQISPPAASSLSTSTTKTSYHRLVTDADDDEIRNGDDGGLHHLRVHRPTPVMYIIHTKSPDDDVYSPYHQQSDQQQAYISDQGSFEFCRYCCLVK